MPAQNKFPSPTGRHAPLFSVQVRHGKQWLVEAESTHPGASWYQRHPPALQNFTNGIGNIWETYGKQFDPFFAILMFAYENLHFTSEQMEIDGTTRICVRVNCVFCCFMGGVLAMAATMRQQARVSCACVSSSKAHLCCQILLSQFIDVIMPIGNIWETFGKRFCNGNRPFPTVYEAGKETLFSFLVPVPVPAVAGA